MWNQAAAPRHARRNWRRAVAEMALAVMTIWGIGGCTTAGGGPTLTESFQPTQSGIMVRVDNRNTHDMRIYVVRGSTEIGLGSVGSLETRSFRVRSSVLGPSGYVELLARPLGRRDAARLRPTPVRPGQELEWQLETHLGNSSAMVRDTQGRR